MSAVSVSMGVVHMFRCISTRRTNKCFLTIHLLRYFSVLFFLFCFLFFFPLCNCLFGRVTVCLVPFSNLLLLRTRKKKKRVTEDKAVNYKKRIAPGVAPNTHSQCHILHTPKELSLYILFIVHGVSLFCFVLTW